MLRTSIDWGLAWVREHQGRASLLDFHREGREGREGLPKQKLLLWQSFASLASLAVKKALLSLDMSHNEREKLVDIRLARPPIVRANPQRECPANARR